MSKTWERRVVLGKNTKQSKGWHSRGYLPHLDAAQLVQHITFHLADSLPTDAIKRIQSEIDKLPDSEQALARSQRTQEWLDAGSGSCLLREASCARIVEDALLYGDGVRYRLLAWVVMPNHVHVLIEQKAEWPLAKVVQSWKRHTSREIHRLDLGALSCTRQNSQNAEYNSALPANSNPPLWQRDYWDRFVRNERHFQTIKRYIEENPVTAGLATNAQQWPWGSAHRESPE